MYVAAGREVHRLGVGEDSWTTYPTPSTSGGILTAVGERLILSGGGGQSATGWGEWVLDEQSGSWTELPPAPVPGGDRFAADMGGELAIFASRGHRSKEGAAFDFDTGTWRDLASPNSYGYQFWMVDGLGYLAPHLEGEPGGIYDPATDLWSPLPPAPADDSWDPDISGVIGPDSAEFGEYDFGWVIDVANHTWINIPFRENHIWGPKTAWGRNMVVYVSGLPAGDDDEDTPGPGARGLWMWSPD